VIYREIELLAPARNAEIGRQAILHGADAVYIGPESFGARKMAGNKIEDIAALCEFAHRFRARIYATVNTLIYPSELKAAERMIYNLYRVGVDALIVQDLSVLKLDIPPIDLHASTQCDNSTLDQFLWLASLGFSQIVAARELSVQQLAEVCRMMPAGVKVEAFVHGALCVSYSGRCNMGYATCGRSGNRGECPQLCRLPYSLTDAAGKEVAPRAHWLSLKDLNATSVIESMIRAGVSSFKIEGRLKDEAYVKNITSHYSNLLNDIIAKNRDSGLRRMSCGRSETTFTPDVDRSFNRSYTTYMLKGKRPAEMAAKSTPKSIGGVVTDPVHQLVPGDGIAWIDKKGDAVGTYVNGVLPDGSIMFAPGAQRPPRGAEIRKSYDKRWQNIMQGKTATRLIDIDVTIDSTGISASDERGIHVRVPLTLEYIAAKKPYSPQDELSRLGNTIYRLRSLDNRWPSDRFIPNSVLADARRRLANALDISAEACYKYTGRRKTDPDIKFDKANVTRCNVANKLSEEVFAEHGMADARQAVEVAGAFAPDIPLMRCKYCLLHEIGKCRKKDGGKIPDLYLHNGSNRFRLEFDCSRCVMLVYKS